MWTIQTQFLTLTANGSYITIESTEHARVAGEIKPAPRLEAWIFVQLHSARPSSYAQWAEDSNPVECGAVLLRIDDSAHDAHGQLLVELDHHPARGLLTRGQICGAQKMPIYWRR